MNALRLSLIAGSALLALGGLANAMPGYQSVYKGDPYTYSAMTASSVTAPARAESCFISEPTFSTMGQHINGSRLVNICDK